MDKINLVIDGKSVTAERGCTILQAAQANGINIPTLCHDESVELYGACGICIVEVEGSPKLHRSCATKAEDAMVVTTNSSRVLSARKVSLELLLSDHTGDCRAPCKLNCPAGTDAQGYVQLVKEGKYKEAVELIKDTNPLPASIGRVCPHPCETACRRQMVEEPISIAFLKSFAADMDLASNDTFRPDIADDSGKTVAIVGGGPAGLTAAYFLRTKGHEVVIYDSMPQMGGMLRYGIPEYRLPKKVLDREIAEIERLGVELKNNVRIGKDIQLDDLRNGYDAVLIAIGAWVSSNMKLAGDDLKGVYGGIDMLCDVALGNEVNLGQKVAIVGGGNTAMDACRTAVRLGAREVYVVYRRTKAEMPADEIEIKEAQEEGVVFKFLTNPVELIGKNGKLTAVKVQKMELGEPDSSGRRRPVPVQGAYEEIAIDSFIMAIGQAADVDGFESLEINKWGNISADESTFCTSIENVFAAGDVTNNGAGIAIDAIGEAGKAALVIDSYLDGKTVSYNKPYYVEKEVTAEDLQYWQKKSRTEMPHNSPETRRNNFNEVNFGFSQEDAKNEASRCLDCGCHDYYECKLIKHANDYMVEPSRLEGEKHSLKDIVMINPLLAHDARKCVLCGLCVRVCDEDVGKTILGLKERGFKTVVNSMFQSKEDQEFCKNCGKCELLCPTGAMQKF